MRDQMQNHNPRYASTASPADEQFSQASARMYAIYTDQFGREWGADVERKTMNPCGPWSPRFAAPMYPPRQYIRVTDTMRMRCFVDLDAWLRDLRQRHVDYRDQVIREAQRILTDQYHTAYVQLPDGRVRPTNAALIHRVGPAPEPFELVVAMQAKNRWMLGLRNPDGSAPQRPKHPIVDEYFPVPVEVKLRDPFTGEVIEDPFATDPGTTPPTALDPFEEGNEFEPHAEYPYMYGPGRWDLTEGDHRARLAGAAQGFQGTRADAVAELEARQERAEFEQKTHKSWG